MSTRCEYCGDSRFTRLDAQTRRVGCVDIRACIARAIEQELADKWYVEELERLRERAPA